MCSSVIVVNDFPVFLFSRLQIALENLLLADATECFKYQVLADHLKVDEALLVADSYCMILDRMILLRTVTCAPDSSTKRRDSKTYKHPDGYRKDFYRQ